MFGWYGSEWELMMTCRQRHTRWHEPRDRNMSRYLEITRLPGIIVTCTFSVQKLKLVGRLDCENFKVIIQIFTGCKWELICTLPTLIGKQIEKLHCQLSPGREHWQDGATDNQRINTRQNRENTVTARVPGGLWLTEIYTYTTSALCLENLQKLYIYM